MKDNISFSSFFESFNSRVNILIFFIVLSFFILIFRLFDLQVIDGKEYRLKAEDQYVHDSGDVFNRGNIYFKDNKNYLSVAAQMSSQYDIAIDPRTIKKMYKSEKAIDDLYNDLKNVFDKPYKDIATSTNLGSLNFLSKEDFNLRLKKDSAFEIIVNNVSQEIVDNLISLQLKGIVINRKKVRHYSENEIGAKVLGFVGYNNNQNKKTGLYGIERYYNDVLNRDTRNNNVNFFAEVFADLQSNDFGSSTSAHNDTYGDLNLTIDIGVQRFLYNILLTTKTKWNSDIVGGIIMDPNDGSIIAMEELPGFNPNNYSKVDDIKNYNNNLISGVYEMGSIIKPLTVAAAIDAGVVDLNTTYNDTGSVELNGFRIWNFDKQARGPNTKLQTVLDKSLNVGIAFIVQKMGGETLSEYFKKYGLGEEVGIDLPNEASGLTNNLDSNVMVDSVTAGFGQGIALTPIQTIRALATLGNGGKLVNPHVVDSITSQTGEIKKIIPDAPEEIFKNSSTSNIISQMLVHVVDTSMKSGDPLHTVAAKTGTAQMVDIKTHKYFEDKYLHSFFGYFPAQNPKYIIFLYQTNPKGAEYASQTLKESFFDLVQFLISYYEVPPDRNGIPKYTY